MNNLRRIDLNLLVTLDVLLTEQNVTRAAERLYMSQPAVSVHLAKLRDLLGDPLLLPGPRGMRPTARAEALRGPLRDALESLSRAVSPAAAFDPANADLTWRIAATDYTESTLVLPVLQRLRAAAPRTRLAVFDLSPSRVARRSRVSSISRFTQRMAHHRACVARPCSRSAMFWWDGVGIRSSNDGPRSSSFASWSTSLCRRTEAAFMRAMTMLSRG